MLLSLCYYGGANFTSSSPRERYEGAHAFGETSYTVTVQAKTRNTLDIPQNFEE
jgi:hypothetical protein